MQCARIVPYYHIALVHSNSTAMLEPRALLHELANIGIRNAPHDTLDKFVNDEQDGFRSGDDLGAVLDQYLGGEELKELILEEGNVFGNDLS